MIDSNFENYKLSSSYEESLVGRVGEGLNISILESGYPSCPPLFS